MVGRSLRSASRSLKSTNDQDYDENDSRDSTSSRETTPYQARAKARESDDISSTASVRLLTEEEWPKNETVLDMPKLLTPRSYYEPFEPPARQQKEWEVVRDCIAISDGNTEEILLTDFTVYRDDDRYPLEMCCLHSFETKHHASQFFFDGVLSAGGHKAWVKKVPIHAIPIDGYGVRHGSTVGGQIWIQSSHNKRRSLYYRLRDPAREYRRFWFDFLWVADLAKHFVDYLNVKEDEGVDVTMQSFVSGFYTWLSKMHGGSSAFQAWKEKHPSNDFRTSVVAHFGFLWKECRGVFDDISMEFHSLWKQAFFQDKYKSEKDTSDKTVVTPYIYDLFEHMPFAKVLESTQLHPRADEARNALISARRLEKPHDIDQTVPNVSSKTSRIRVIKRGDIISTKRDESGAWKLEKAIGDEDVNRWFALVQNVKVSRRGKKTFDVIWFYRPVDTICGIMKYPWKNELFLSEHCSCSESEKIMEDEVLGVHDVHFWGDATTSAELFCRQTYDQDSRKWMTLEKHHLRCKHIRQGASQEMEFKRGDTVLVCLQRGAVESEPCVVMHTFFEGNTKICELRRLHRRSQLEHERHSKPNELVWTERFVQVRVERLQAACYVRYFNDGEQIPSPYNRDGVGGFFYVTHRENESTTGPRCVPLQRRPESLRQGFDPGQQVTKLRGLDLFCGGGNFGRGLEDAGAIEMKWINDYDSNAIHTYMANVNDLDAVHPFLGSIDLLQRHALKGDWDKSNNVPRIGDVDFISAGSPCPGFSTLTGDKTTPRQRKNQSLVASFASFVDVYRPKYGLLENVAGIISPGVNRHQDVFSQLVCAVVGLGYQLRFFMRDAYACGSPQARTRVFLIFAAPGCRLPEVPLITHSHPQRVRRRKLGLLPTGDPMGEREFPTTTPFKFRSALEANADLPRIYDGKTETCIAFPDHRIAVGTTKAVRLSFENIPIQPFAMDFSQAWYGSKGANVSRKSPGPWLTPSQRPIFPPDKTNGRLGPSSKGSSAYGRVHPHLPVNAIVTKQTARDFKNGRQLHWQEHRVLTLLEARRAQGFRDEEVLLGNLSDQFRIVGNSVAREVALAIGVTIREAWDGTLHEDDAPRELLEANLEGVQAGWVGVDDQMDLVVPDDSSTREAEQARQSTAVQLSPLSSTVPSPSIDSRENEQIAVPQTNITECLVTPAQTPGRLRARRSHSRQRSSPVPAALEDEQCELEDHDDNDDTGTFSLVGPPKRSPPPCKDRVGAIKNEVFGEQSGHLRLGAQTAPRVLDSMLRRQSSILDAFSFATAVTVAGGSITKDTDPSRRFSIPLVGSKRKRDSMIGVETETEGASTPSSGSGSVDGHRPKKQKRNMAKSLTRYRVSRSNSPMPR